MPHGSNKIALMRLFYSASKTWSLGPGQNTMALPVQVRTLLEYWSIGVLECWQKQKPEFILHCSFHYSITPPLHHSSRLPLGGKTMEAPSGGRSKPGPLGPDFLFFCPRTRHSGRVRLSGRDPWFDRPFDRLTVLSKVEGESSESSVESNPFWIPARVPLLRDLAGMTNFDTLS